MILNYFLQFPSKPEKKNEDSRRTGRNLWLQISFEFFSLYFEVTENYKLIIMQIIHLYM
jgi:oligoendopeptidase F